MDIGRIEAAEASLNAFIEKRAREAKDGHSRVNAEAAAERMAAENRERRYREAVLHQRLEFHEEQIHRHTATFERLIRRHKSGLRLVEEALGLSITKETKGDAA